MRTGQEQLAAWAREAQTRYILRRRGRVDLVEALLAGGDWKEFRPEGWAKPLKMVAFRFDFGQHPERFAERMDAGRVVALCSRERGGETLFDRHPFVTYTIGGKLFVHFYLLEDLL